MEAGAWPFLVGGVICLVKSDNERDLNLLNSTVHRGVPVRDRASVRRLRGFSFSCGRAGTS